jgi:tight adherence protein B
MRPDITVEVVKWASQLLVVLAIFVATWAVVSDPQSFLWRLWARYISHIERKLRLMFIFSPGVRVAQGQMAAMFLVLFAHAAMEVPFWWAIILVIALGPPWYIERMRAQRVETIEKQIDGFLMTLANALKATPSIADAFMSVQGLTPPPLQQEIELAVKEMRLGSSLDQSILHMGGRVGSRQFDSALSAILIGRQLGGNLPQILDTTASTFREMGRLEGFVRSKTAEGKAQLWVLAIFPFAIMYALNAVQPGYFQPLTDSVIGYILATGAGVFWVASIVVARKVLAVDI